MMDYKEMAAIVKERGDAIIAEKARRATLIKRISFSASSVAAVAIAALCVWHNKDLMKYPDPESNNIITNTSTPVTTQEPGTSMTVTSTATNTSSPEKTTSETKAVSTTVTSTAFKATSGAASSAVSSDERISSDTVKTSVVSAVTASSVPAVTTEAVTTYDYNYYYNEGRSTMRGLVAISAALISMANSIPASAAENTAYTRVPEEIEIIEGFKTCVEELGMDIDLNCDGKIDIFDVYAAYRFISYPQSYPDYIRDKADACEKILDEYNSTHKKQIWLDDMIPYYFEYYPVSLEYFQPNYYIDNCPDVYSEYVPLEYVRREGGINDITEFYDSMFFSKEDDRYVNVKYHSAERKNPLFEVDLSPIYTFIQNYLRFDICYSTAGYNVIKELVENNLVDVDINSDGKFDYDDIMLLGFFEEHFYDRYDNTSFGYWDDDIYHELDAQNEHDKRRTYEWFLSYYDSWNEDIRWGYFNNHRLSETEWSKAMKFFDTTLLYNYNSYDVLETLFTYYIINNKVDFKIFDDNYYNGVDNYLHSCFWGYLKKYKKIAEAYGVNKIRDPEEEPVDLRFIRYDIEEMFPEYYAAVKSGDLPEPDINQNGRIDIQDYAYFQDIFAEFIDPDLPSYMIYVTIDAPQYVRDAFNNDYDFNNNGISCDLSELECIELYIAKALGASDYRDIQDMLDVYYAENPDLDPMVKANKILQDMIDAENAEKQETLSGSKENVNNLQSYMSSLELFKTITGDANIDGNVDISDAVFIMQTISNPDSYSLTPQGRKNADSNGDGVTSYDALAIQRKLLGL